jgi:hypothetical protein
LLTYTNLPGIIGERFFAVLDLSKNDYVDLREFVHGFFKVYYSNLETKIKLSFDVYVPFIFASIFLLQLWFDSDFYFF